MSTSSAVVRERRQESRAERVLTLRQDGFPRRPLFKWLVRIAFATPFLVVAIVNNLVGRQIESTPNAALLERAGQMDWTRVDVGLLEQFYPPLTTLLVSVIPGGRLGLAIFGALGAGWVLHRLLEIMVQRRFPISRIVLLLLAIGANPLFAYTVTENIEGSLTLALFGVGVADMVRFVAWNDTRAGFRGGLLFMLAVLSSPAGFFYVIVGIATAPFLRLGRRNQDGARAANALILAYPTISAILAFAFLEFLFLGRPFGFLQYVLGGGQSLADVTTVLFTTFNGFLVLAPVLAAWLIAIAVRKPGSILISTLVFFAVVGNSVLGFLPANSAGDTFLLMVIMAIALVPRAKGAVAIVLVEVIALLQIVIAWAAAFNRPIVVEWMNALVGAAG